MTTPPRTLEEIAKELARSEHWPDRKGEFALCGPCTERSDRKLSPEQRAGDIVDAWEHFEGETMRDGHRATLESLIASQIREAADTAVAPYVQMMQRIAREALRPAAPEAKESDCTCGEQWPCPLHGGPPAAPEPTPSEKCPYCGLTTCRYGADPTSTCHAKGDSCRCLEQPDLPLGHEFVAGHPHPAYQSYCALHGIFGLCGQPESAHRRKP